MTPFSKVSVLVPTRRRVARLQALLDSWKATVGYGDVSAELIFRIDSDDAESRMFLENHPYTVLVGPRYDGYRSLPTFFEEMRGVAVGDLFLTGNDDMLFRTPHWPGLVLEVANQYPDGIFALGVNTHNAENFPFAIVSRKAVEAMGRIHDERVFWGDVYLRDVMAHFGRAIRVPAVTIDHEWAGWERDRTFVEAGQGDHGAWDSAYSATHAAAVNAAVEKLSKVAA